MKTKFLSAIITAAVLLWQADARAQSTNAAPPELQALVQKVQAKIMAGKNTEADFADELKTFDGLIAQDKAAAKPDDAAQLLYMKAKLYQEIFSDMDRTKVLLAQLKTDYPDTIYGKHVDELLASLDSQSAAEKMQAEAKKKQDEILGDGKAFPDFSETDLNGKPISVGALKGKVVMVDFWATWCPPCRAELPNVIAAYKKYHAAGFDIIGVSLDRERDKLDAFLKETDGMTWPQFYDSQNKLADKYAVESIPFAVLIGQDGNIIGKGDELRGAGLEAAVAAALAKK